MLSLVGHFFEIIQKLLLADLLIIIAIELLEEIVHFNVIDASKDLLHLQPAQRPRIVPIEKLKCLTQ